MNEQVKIKMKTDCGNSPAKNFLKEVNIAFARGNAEFLLKSVSDKVHWEILGDQVIKGKEAFAAALQKMKTVKTNEMNILHIITHGREAAVSGTITLEDNTTYGFCDVYQLVGAGKRKIKSITSYVVAVD